MTVPDLIEPFVGWKGLLADARGVLFSPRGDEWPPNQPMVADKKPSAGNGNGIYAVIDFESLKKNAYNWRAATEMPGEKHVWVIAQVALWGDVRKGVIGYRAEFAYPNKVYVPAQQLLLGRVIRDRYGCALARIDRFTGRRS